MKVDGVVDGRCVDLSRLDERMGRTMAAATRPVSTDDERGGPDADNMQKGAKGQKRLPRRALPDAAPEAERTKAGRRRWQRCDLDV